MNYESALEYIHAVQWAGHKPGLTRTRTLLAALGDPHKQLRFIHVAGTNGKGSTAAMLASCLQAAGYRVGLYTSPFLLLAAALWVRSSPRLYEWLLAHRCFGGYIRNFRENRAIPLRAKVVSIALMWGTMLYCIFGLLDGRWWAQVGLLAVAVGVTWHILSFATLR